MNDVSHNERSSAHLEKEAQWSKEMMNELAVLDGRLEPHLVEYFNVAGVGRLTFRDVLSLFQKPQNRMETTKIRQPFHGLSSMVSLSLAILQREGSFRLYQAR